MKAPNDVDKMVGSRVRLRRTMLGMSQEKLADALGVTFQQVQKYEKGTNRISASRLHKVAEVLDVSLDYLFGSVDSGAEQAGGFAEPAGRPYEAEILTADGLKLLKFYQSIADGKVRRRILELVQTLSEHLQGRSE